MANPSWDAKHAAPESLVNFAAHARPGSSYESSYYSQDDNDSIKHDDKHTGTAYDDPFALDPTYGYPPTNQGNPYSDPKSLQDSTSKDNDKGIYAPHGQQSEDGVSTRDSLVKSAADFSGADLYSNHLNKPVEQLGIPSHIHNHP